MECLKTFYCESKKCAYNRDGICRFALVKGRMPVTTENDGCTEGVIIHNGYGFPVTTQKSVSPCDVCMYSPPSSGDGKPCCVCPAASID